MHMAAQLQETPVVAFTRFQVFGSAFQPRQTKATRSLVDELVRYSSAMGKTLTCSSSDFRKSSHRPRIQTASTTSRRIATRSESQNGIKSAVLYPYPFFIIYIPYSPLNIKFHGGAICSEGLTTETDPMPCL